MLRPIITSLTVLLFMQPAAGFAQERPLFEDELPEDFEVYAVGTYRGEVSVKAKLDDSDHDVTQIEVVVNKPGKPIVVVLTAYDPVVWHVGRTKDTKLAAVIVSGYHGQAIIGIDKETPQAISTYKKKGGFRYFYATRASKELLAMNESVKRLVGREIHHFENKPQQGVFYIGEKPNNEKSIVYPLDLKIDGKAQPERLVVGQAGLDALVKEKKLRPATNADIEAWVDKASEKFKRFNPKLRVETYMRVGRTYVVLEKVTLPRKLFGAHSRAFIIPEKVPFPEGPRSHNSFTKWTAPKSAQATPRDRKRSFWRVAISHSFAWTCFLFDANRILSIKRNGHGARTLFG